MTGRPDAGRRARRWFWALLLVAVLAMGGLYRAVSAPAGPATAAAVLVSGTVLALATVQAARILRALRGPLVLDLRRFYKPADRG
jgi:hypothetical protein